MTSIVNLYFYITKSLLVTLTLSSFLGFDDLQGDEEIA